MSIMISLGAVVTGKKTAIAQTTPKMPEQWLKGREIIWLQRVYIVAQKIYHSIYFIFADNDNDRIHFNANNNYYYKG